MKAAVAVAGALLCLSLPVAHAQLYWNTNGAVADWTDANWGTSAGGPFTTDWTDNTDTVFNADSTVNSVRNTNIGNVTVAAGVAVTLNPPFVGDLGTGGQIRTITVGVGGVLDFNGQKVDGTSGTGFIKDGVGVWNLGSQITAFDGAFTLNAGTVVIGGDNALGKGELTINGGTLAADSSNRTPRNNSVTIGGNFQLGAFTSVVPFSGNVANITLGAVSLGAATRTITIGANGTYELAGVVSGAPGAGLTIDALSGATGNITLSAANTYSGPTTVSAGTLIVEGNGTLGSGDVVVASGATLDVSTKNGNLTIASGTTLSGAGTIIGDGGRRPSNGGVTISGALSPGDSSGGDIGTFIVNGGAALTLSGTTIMTATGPSTSDRVIGDSALTYGGTFNLTLSSAGSDGEVYDLFDFSSQTGDFASINFTAGGSSLAVVRSVGQGWTAATSTMSYVFLNSTGALTLSAVPEPAEYGAAFAAFLGALVWLRRCQPCA